MADQKRNPLAIFGLIVLIAIAIFFIARSAKSGKSDSSSMTNKVDWICEKDGYRFVAAQPKSGAAKCPKDGSDAVRVVYYYCSVHKHRFEAYRKKPAGGMYNFYQVPGGKWIKSMDAPKVVCPLGNDDRKTLRYSSPK